MSLTQTRPHPRSPAARGSKSATYNGPSRGIVQDECTLSHINRRSRRVDFFTDKLLNEYAGYTFTLEQYLRFAAAS